MAETSNRDAWRIGPAPPIAVEMSSRVSGGIFFILSLQLFPF
jgi:hypothetical protein